MKQTKRLLSLLLCAAMMLSLLPVTGSASDYDDGCECYWCGHYHWGDYVCDECGACSDSCDNSDCYEVTHCTFCGACLCYVDHCIDGGLPACMDCLQSEGYHCADCGECDCYNEGNNLCGNCFRCGDCVEICDECGWCFDCGEHCEICGACWPDMCAEGGDHCVECCEDEGWLCPECGECSEGKGIETCEICGLCTDCCEENACPECGLCAGESDFDEHFCEECGACLNETDMCDDCGLCLDCCRSLAADLGCACEEYCWIDVDDSHVCQDCGECFGVVDACPDCCDEGEYRCVDCCAAQSEMAGCDCAIPVCVNSSEWAAHFAAEHTAPAGKHDAEPKNTWSFDASSHWHDCRWCDDAAHVSLKYSHSFNSQGRCTVCGYSTNSAIVITVQPRSVKSTIKSPDEVPNTVSFKVIAYGPDGQKGLHYQWYGQLGADYSFPIEEWHEDVEGYDTNVVSNVPVPASVCYQPDYYHYYCVITDDYGHEVTTDKVTITSDHVFTGWCQYNSKCLYCFRDARGHSMECVGDGCDKHGPLTPHTYSEWKWVAPNGVRDRRYRVCSVCGYYDEYYVHQHKYDMTLLVQLVGDETATVTGDPDTGVTVTGTVKTEDGKVLTAGMSPTEHWIGCGRGTCDLCRHEAHDWGPWNFTGAKNSPTAGGMWRECKTCGYTDSTLHYDRDGEPLYWEFGVHPITTVNCTASVALARDGDSIRLTPAKLENKTFRQYRVMIEKYSEATGEYTAIASSDLVNDGVLKLPKTNIGKGEVSIEALYTDGCAHRRTEIVDAQAPTCTKMGYTGDTVCADCGHLLKTGLDIEETGHGKEVPVTVSIPRTDAKGREILDSHGYRTYIAQAPTTVYCSDNGKDRCCYTGDTVCADCGEIITKGHTSGVKHNYVPVETATALKSVVNELGLRPYTPAKGNTPGYSGDEICTNKDCLKVHYGREIPVKYISRVNITVKVWPDRDTPITKDDVILPEGLELVEYGWGDHNGNEVYTNDSVYFDADEVKCYLWVRPAEGYWFADYETPLAGSATSTAPAVRAHINGSGADKVTGFVSEIDKTGKLYIASRWMTQGDIAGLCGTVTSEGSESDPIYLQLLPDDPDRPAEAIYEVVVHGTSASYAFSGIASGSYILRAIKKDHTTVDTKVKVGSGMTEQNVTLTPKPADCGGDRTICPSAPYTDVAPYGNWAHAGIDFCIREGLMNGINANTFDPRGSMTRAMVVTVLWRQAGSPKPKKAADFDDLTQSWYMDAVAWAAENGVVNGVGGTRFAPGDPVTREQMATILQRYTSNILKKDTNRTTDISGYPDYADVSSFAVAPMAWANAEGLITGVSSGGRTTLNPKDGATREQVATILMRFVQNIAN